jgi:hypothetical protein
MRIFDSGLFWFVEGILTVVVILAVRAWAQDRGLPMPLWKWALFLTWMGLVGFTIAFVGTSFGEGEPVAATRGGLLFGLISIIAGVGLWRVLGVGGREGREPSASTRLSEG